MRIRPETPKLNLLNIKPQKPEQKKYYQWPGSNAGTESSGSKKERYEDQEMISSS
jgi:hypothetical protein